MGFLGAPLFGSMHLTTQFYGLRLLLGIAEAGLFPGVIVYLWHGIGRKTKPGPKDIS